MSDNNILFNSDIIFWLELTSSTQSIRYYKSSSFVLNITNSLIFSELTQCCAYLYLNMNIVLSSILTFSSICSNVGTDFKAPSIQCCYYLLASFAIKASERSTTSKWIQPTTSAGFNQWVPSSTLLTIIGSYNGPAFEYPQNRIRHIVRLTHI